MIKTLLTIKSDAEIERYMIKENMKESEKTMHLLK